MKIRGQASFTREFAKASKELRTGKKQSSGLGGKKKPTAKEKSIQRRETGFLIGVLKEAFRKKK
jgi:hypothetical protein